MAQRNQKNYPERMRCHGCLRPKCEATNPPEYSKINRGRMDKDNADASQPSKEQLHKRETRARKRRERAGPGKAMAEGNQPSAATATSGPGIVAETMAAQAAGTVPLTRLSLPAELLLEIPLLANAIKGVTDSIASEAIPSIMKAKEPAIIMTKFIGERGPTAKIAKKAELEADIVKLNSALAPLIAGGDSMTELANIVRAKIEAHEAALSKLAKDAPSPVRELKAVQEAKSTFKVQAQGRLDREAMGAQKATDRKNQRRELLNDFKAQITILETGLTSLENENLAKHSNRAAAAAELDAKVIVAFDAKIAELLILSPQAAQDQATASPVLTAPPPQPVLPTAPGSLAELETAKKDIEEKIKMIATLQSQLATSVNQAKAEFGTSFEITDKDLPDINKPGKEALTEYAALHLALQSWVTSGASQPFDWGALKEVAANGGQPTSLFQELFGETNWKLWYPTALPEDTYIVPRMAVMLVFSSLSKILAENESMEVQAEATKRGSSSFLAIQESGKKFKRSQ